MMHTCACGVHEQYTSGCFVVLQVVYLVALCSQCELKRCSTVKSYSASQGPLRWLRTSTQKLRRSQPIEADNAVDALQTVQVWQSV
eukprot:19592-Heterococcus_DN1.PRE.2